MNGINDNKSIAPSPSTTSFTDRAFKFKMSCFDFFANFYTLILTAAIIFVSVIHYKRKYNVWSSRGVPGPRAVPFIGSIGVFVSTLPDLFTNSVKKYGKIYGGYDSFGPTLVVSDPKVVKQILVKDFHHFTNRRDFRNFDDILSTMMSIAVDNEWKRLRKVISPTFSTGKIKRMKPLIEQCIVNAVEEMQLISAKKDHLNLKLFWSRFTLEVIARCCFATGINAHKDPENEFFKHVTSFFKPPGFTAIVSMIAFFTLPTSLWKRLPLKMVSNVHVEYVANVVRHLLRQRREGDGNHNDFLQLMIEANKENEERSEPLLSENEIIGNCILFFVAGYETTANLLSWVSYFLAMNPNVQDKLFDELNENFPGKNSIDYDLANKLPYLDAVFSESLRLYPPLVHLERTASVEVELEDTGVKIPAKTVVMIPLIVIHRDAEYFEEPELFKPERFLDNNRENIDPYAYIPFGAGPRNCVAMRFALIEAKLALIQAVLNFKFERCEKTPEKPKYYKLTQFSLADGICVNIIKR